MALQSATDLLHPLVLLRAFYLAASLLILVIQTVPALRTRFLAYGSRATTSKETKGLAPAQTSPLTQRLDYAATIQVPHNYFTHFYIVSVVCSLFWGWKLRLWDGSVAGHTQRIVWALMLLQGVRRMLESYFFTSTSKSRMWFAHWVLGLLFYITINVAIWVETPARRGDWWGEYRLVPAIVLAQSRQHYYHDYFYRLRTQYKDYQLPENTIGNTLCPHYFWEIMIYAIMSFLAAPAERWVNWTLVCATIFVATNLGVTAVGTKQWYMEKFGAEKVGLRKRMIPWIW